MTTPTAAVRAWARANGHVVSDRGRIPAAVQAAYDAAHAEPEVVAPPPPAVPPPAAAPPPGQAPWGPGQPSGWYAPGPFPPAPGRDGFSVAALVLGILPALGGILAIVFGAIALSRIRRSGRRGRGFAIAGIVLGSLWLLGIVVAVVISAAAEADRDAAGAVVGAGDVEALELRVGDCAAEPPVGNTLTIRLVPCGEPHAAEVYAEFSLTGNAFPGDDEVARFAGGGCRRRLTEVLGAGAGRYDLYYLHPTRQTWRGGDRGVSCLAGAPDGEKLTAVLPRET